MSSFARKCLPPGIALIALVLGGCHYYTETIPERGDDNPLVGAWRLVAMQAPGAALRPVPSQPPYTLEIGDDDRLAGLADCNRYFGGYERAKNGQLRVLALGATRAACPPESISDEFLRLLGAAQQFEIRGDELRIGSTEAALLVFVR